MPWRSAAIALIKLVLPMPGGPDSTVIPRLDRSLSASVMRMLERPTGVASSAMGKPK